jgi:hypothetical protein
MRTDRFLVLVSLVVATALASAEPRNSGHGDRSRHPEEATEPPPTGFGAVTRPDRTAAERVDPAIRRFWSDRCVNQRRHGLPHTGDCDNPAYSGGAYVRPVPDGGYGRWPYGWGRGGPDRRSGTFGRPYDAPIYRPGGDYPRSRW